MSIQLIVIFKIKPEKLASFLEIMKEVKKSLSQVKGCKKVQILQANDDKYTMSLIETWQSIDMHKIHIKNIIESGDWKYILSHLREDPISQYYYEFQ